MQGREYSKHILFITSSRIGDAVLSTGVLQEMLLRYPDAGFTIACGPLVTSLFEGFPNLEALYPMEKKKYHKHWFDLWRAVAGRRYEVIVDLRDSIVSRTLLAQKRYIMGRTIDKNTHKVLQNAAVIGSKENPPAPVLWFTKEQQAFAEKIISAENQKHKVIGVGPAANWAAKTWPIERFEEIVQWLRTEEGGFQNAKIAVFAAPGEENIANKLLESLPEDVGINVIAKGNPAQAAAVIARCDFYIGNDSGLMHCAAACGVPTIGLFGPSYPHIYAPWGERSVYARTPQSFDELIAFDGYDAKTVGCLMDSLSVDVVKSAIKTMHF